METEYFRAVNGMCCARMDAPGAVRAASPSMFGVSSARLTFSLTFKRPLDRLPGSRGVLLLDSLWILFQKTSPPVNQARQMGIGLQLPGSSKTWWPPGRCSSVRCSYSFLSTISLCERWLGSRRVSCTQACFRGRTSFTCSPFASFSWRGLSLGGTSRLPET